MKHALLPLPIAVGLAGALLALNVDTSEREQAVEINDAINANSQPLRLPSKSVVGRSDLSPGEAKIASRAKLMPDGVETVLAINIPLKHGQFVWNEQGAPQGPIQIWVDLRGQTISVFRAGHEIGSAIIVYGTDDNQTPLGKFEILSKHREYRSRRYGAEMPNAMFITNDGVALHSSVLQPRHATHGCVGLPDEFSRRLFEVAQIGTVVHIARSDPDIIDRIVAKPQTTVH